MKVKDREGVRRALRERVSRRVAGHGIAAHAIDDAIERVLAALDADRTSAPAPGAGSVVVVLSSVTPDLASRVRALLPSDAAPDAIASATVGRHTVVTARVSREGRELLERAAASLPASLSVLPVEGRHPA